MNWKHLLGMVFVLGVAFVGVFLASPSTITVQADEFVLLDGYAGRFADALGESLAFEFYNVQIKDTRDDTPIETPDFFVGIDGLFNHGRSARFIYAKPIGSENNWVQKKLIGFTVEDEKKYELMVVFNEDGSIDMTRTVLGVVPLEFSKGVPFTTYAEPGSILSIEEQKVLKPDEDFTNVSPPKTSDSGFKDLVCFDDQVEGLPQSNRCRYLTVSQYGSVGEVKKDNLPILRELISTIIHKDKKSNPIPTNEGVYDEGPAPTGPLVDNPDIVIEVDGKVLPKGESLPPKSSDSVPIEIMGANPAPFSFFTLPAKKLPLYTSSRQPLFFSTTSLFYEDFEGAFPSGSWSVTDLDSGNGLDYWDDTSASAHYGSWSAWVSDVGDQWSTVVTDSFNGSISGWTATDANPINGADTWGYSTYKYDSSPGSAYSAGNSSTGGSHLYDNFMSAYFTKNTTYNASSWSNAKIRFDTWYSTESGIDLLQVIVSSNGGSSWTPICSYSGNSSGWKSKECVVSSQYLTSQFKYGFHFSSDDSITLEGAYVDDVTLEKYVSNASVSNYDDFQDSHMKYGPISVSGYAGTVFEFWIKGTPEPIYDNLWVQLSGNGSSWTTLDQINSSFLGWTKKSYPFTSTTGNAYFRLIFDTDSSAHNYTGYYIDDVKVYGNYLLPDGSLCSSPSECASGVCGGADTDYYIHCNTDGSSTVYANNLVYVNTCGGAGTYSQTQYDATNGSCSSGKACDADLAYTAETFSTSTICKFSINQSCSSSSECWNDNGGVDCQGPIGNKICTYGDNGSYCTSDAHCDSGLVCDTTNQVCSTGAGVGNACTKDSDCASKVCVYTSSSQATCQGASAYSPFVLTTDTYDSSVSNSYSDELDGVAFTGYTVKPVTLDLKQSADYLCYDFNNDGVYDACYYDLDVGLSSCNGVLSFPSSVPVKQQCDIDSYSGCTIGNGLISPQICSSGSCAVNSNSIKKSDVRAKVFYDCDNSEQLQSAVVLPNDSFDDYWIINPKFASCDFQSSPGSGYTIGGKYGTAYSSAKSLAAFSCSSTQSCSIAADEQYVSTATGTIPSVCKTKPTNSCTQNSDCLYNSCVGNVCQNGFIYESFIQDSLDNPLPNYTVKLTACSSGNTLQTTTTDADGKFTFVAPTGSYGMKLVAPWGDLDFDLGTDYCETFSTGFYGSSEVWVYENKTVVHGKAVNPQGLPSINLPLELSTCQDSTLVSTTTNTSGDFLLTTDSGKQKIKATISGNKVPLSDESGNTCFLNYGDVDLGTMEITPTCNLYDNTCQDPNTRVFGCVPDPTKGCVCQVQYCEAGCTEGASICNPLGTGTLKISVTKSNDPIKNASIKVDGSTQGKTNSLGKLEVNAKHGSHTVLATCPSGSPSGSKTVYLNADYQFVTINLNCPTAQQKGDILIRAENANGYPIANVLVVENDEKIGLTDSYGQLYLEDFDYGSHTISLIYRVTNEEYAGTYQKIVLVDLNQSVVTQEMTILLPGDVGYSQFGATSYSGKLFFLAPAAVVIIAPVAFATLDVVSMAWSASDLCQCILGESYNLSQLGQCVADFANPTCSDIRQCEAGLEKYAKEISNGQCWTESAMLVGDVASPFIPAGLIGHVGAFFISKIDDFKLIEKLGVAGKIVAKGEDFIEIVAENGAKIRAEIDDLAAQTILKGPNVGLSLKALGPEGVIGAGRISTKLDSLGVDSVKISKDLTSVFGEQSMIGVYQTIGKADGKANVYWVDAFANNVKKFDPLKENTVGGAKGAIREILVAKAEGIVDSLKAAAYKVKVGPVDVEYDLITDGLLREVKSPDSLQLSALDALKKTNPSATIDDVTASDILDFIKKQVGNFNAGKSQLPSGVSFEEIHYNIAKGSGENVPSIVIDALEQAKSIGIINGHKVVYV